MQRLKLNTDVHRTHNIRSDLISSSSFDYVVAANFISMPFNLNSIFWTL